MDPPHRSTCDDGVVVGEVGGLEGVVAVEDAEIGLGVGEN